MNPKLKKNTYPLFVSIVLTFMLLLSINPVFAENFHYQNDPCKNCKAMQDIKVDPTAVYGFSPRSDGSLKSYAEYDWSNPILVEKWRNERIDYFNQYDVMYRDYEKMLEEGKSTEEMAKILSQKRNQIRWDSYKDNPEGLEALKKRNLEKYGNEFGPSPEYLFNKYGSWDIVLIKCFSENPGMDACLGLYDERFEYYIFLGEFSEHDIVIDEAVPATTESTGLSEGSHCQKCGLILQEQSITPKLEPTNQDPVQNPPTGLTESGQNLDVAIIALLTALLLASAFLFVRKKANES